MLHGATLALTLINYLWVWWVLWQTKHWAIHRNFNCISSSIHLLLGASFHCTSHLWFYHFVISFTLDHYSVASFLSYFTFHSISFYQARKLYRSMVLEKKRNEAAIVIAAYCRGWKVIELWPPSTVCRTIQFHSVTISFLSTSQLWFYHFIISFTLDHYTVASFFCRISHSFHLISFHQARKLYRSMLIEKERNEAATVLAAYCRGWKVIEMWSLSTVCHTFFGWLLREFSRTWRQCPSVDCFPCYYQLSVCNSKLSPL